MTTTRTADRRRGDVDRLPPARPHEDDQEGGEGFPFDEAEELAELAALLAEAEAAPRLRALREARGLTVEQLAQVAGVSAALLRNIEAADPGLVREHPGMKLDPEDAVNLADALGVRGMGPGQYDCWELRRYACAVCNSAEEDRLLRAFAELQAAAEAVTAAHDAWHGDDGCDCGICDTLHGFLWCFQAARGLVESSLHCPRHSEWVRAQLARGRALAASADAPRIVGTPGAGPG